MIPTGLILIAAICMGIVSFINTDYYSGWLIFLTVGIIALVWGVSIWFQKSNLSRATNILLPIVLGVSISGIFFIFCIVLVIAFSHENPKVYVEGNTLSVVGRSEIPIKLEDVGITPDKYRDTDKHVDKTIFAQYTSYYDNTQRKLADEVVGVSYSLFQSKYDFIINHYLNYNISKSYENYKPSDTSIWDAKKAFYSDETHRYMVVYENCIFLFESDLPLNNKALTTIKEKLNLKEFVNTKAIGA